MFDRALKRHRLRIVIPAYPAFNIYSYIARKTTALGPVCIATVVNEMEGWDVEVIDENNLRRCGPKGETGGADHEFLQRLRPADVVGLYGGLTSTSPRLYEIARFYKEKGIVTLAGGHHFVGGNIEEALSSGIDYVVLGEGEETVKELLRAIESGADPSGIKGIAYRRDGTVLKTPPRELLTDFDQLPVPNFSLVRYAKIKIYPVGRIRGCGMDCEFCTVKGKPRCASPERLLESISFLVETQGAKEFFIIDDLFGQQRSETLKFCRMLQEYEKSIRRRLCFTAQIRLDKAKDPELLSAMYDARIRYVAIGYESPIEGELLAMNKHINPQEMLDLTKIFRKFKFVVHGMFIFGYPLKEGVNFHMPAKERVRHFKKFIKKAKLDTIQVLLPIPLPGTKLRERLEAQNRVYPVSDIGWEYYDGNFPLFEPDTPMSAEDMQAAIKKIMGMFYQFKYMWLAGFHIFSFPSLVFFLHDIKLGWRKWYRPWRNNLIRFGGWMTIKKWTAQFKKDNFPRKLQEARGHIQVNGR